EKKMAKKLRRDKLRMNSQEFDITALDSAVRENKSENSKMMRLITDLSREFTELKNQNHRSEELSLWEAWVRGRIPNNLRFQAKPSIYTAPVPRADDPYVMVRDAAMDTQGDEDVDTDAPRDTQPFEPRGSLRDSQAKRKRVRMEAKRAGGPTGDPTAAPMARECREVANGRPWTKVKQMMTDEFCPTEEVQRLEDKLRHLKLRDMNIDAYTKMFNELALLCLDAVPNEKKKVECTSRGCPRSLKTRHGEKDKPSISAPKPVNATTEFVDDTDFALDIPTYGPVTVEMVNATKDNFDEDDLVKFQELLLEAENPLYEGCPDFIKLSAIVKLLNLKGKYGASNKFFTELLGLLKKMLLAGNEMVEKLIKPKKL
nr:hypothetical protein [Tanacetum cinerariifolium]